MAAANIPRCRTGCSKKSPPGCFVAALDCAHTTCHPQGMHRLEQRTRVKSVDQMNDCRVEEKDVLGLMIAPLTAEDFFLQQSEGPWGMQPRQ
eukprot:3319532-Rhodomonas_salina.2